MDFNLDKLKSYVDLYQITSAANRVKNAIYNYSYYEIKVREATSDEKWGPSSSLMQEIAQATHEPLHFDKIMDAIYSRINNRRDHKWRQVHKTLQLIDYLIKCGSERVIDSLRKNTVLIVALSSFSYVDPTGANYGEMVRKRATAILDLLKSTDAIRAERKIFMQNKGKYIGLSSNSIRASQSCSYATGFYDSATAPRGGYKDNEILSEGAVTSIPTADTTHKPPPLRAPAHASPSLLIDVDEEPVVEMPRNSKNDSDSESWGEFVGPIPGGGAEARPPGVATAVRGSRVANVTKQPPTQPQSRAAKPPHGSWDDAFGSIVGHGLNSLSTQSAENLGVADEIADNPWEK